MIHTRLPIRLALLLLTFALLSPLARGGEITTVRLHSTVRMQGDSVCTLGSIAEITGVQATALNGIQIGITPKVGQWTMIEVESIRKLIDEAVGIRSGSVIVVGHSTSITWRNTLELHESETESAARPLEPVAQPDPTIGDRVRVWLARRYNASPEAIRTTYRESDEEQLNQSAVGRMIEVAEIGHSVNTKLRISVYRGDQFESSFTVSAAVRVQREVLVVKRDIRRGELIEKSMVTAEQRWQPASDAPATPAQVLGLASTGTLRVGDVIRAENVAQPIVIKRGEIISVRSIAGSIVANRRARALEDAREGEIFKLESIDRKNRFTARASGPGLAVIAETTTLAPTSGPIGD